MDDSPNQNITGANSTEESIPKLKKFSIKFSPDDHPKEITIFTNSCVESLFQKKDLMEKQVSLMNNLQEKR